MKIIIFPVKNCHKMPQVGASIHHFQSHFRSTAGPASVLTLPPSWHGNSYTSPVLVYNFAKLFIYNVCVGPCLATLGARIYIYNSLWFIVSVPISSIYTEPTHIHPIHPCIFHTQVPTKNVKPNPPCGKSTVQWTLFPRAFPARIGQTVPQIWCCKHHVSQWKWP